MADECTSTDVCVPGCDSCFFVGGLVEPKLHVRDASGEPVDATVAIAVKLPDGTTTTPPVTHDALDDDGNPQAGEYHAEYLPAQAGQHFYQFNVTGAVTASVGGAFLVAAAMA